MRQGVEHHAKVNMQVCRTSFIMDSRPTRTPFIRNCHLATSNCFFSHIKNVWTFFSKFLYFIIPAVLPSPHQKNLVSLIRQFTKSVNRCFHAVNLCLVFDTKVSSIPDDNGLSFALLRACVNSVTLGSCSQTLDSWMEWLFPSYIEKCPVKLDSAIS